jgi:hypothetical protein
VAQGDSVEVPVGIMNGEATPSIERFRTDRERDVSGQGMYRFS